MINPMEKRRAEQFAVLLDSDDPTHLHSTDSGNSLGDAARTAQPERTEDPAAERGLPPNSLGKLSDGAAEEFAAMLSTGERLGGLGTQVHEATEPDTQWRDATRRRLMAIAADEGIGVTARASARAQVPRSNAAPVQDDLFVKRPRGGRRIAVVSALLGGTVAVSGVSAASGDALPGDTLYGVKRSTERAQLALAGNDMSKAQLYFEFASTRISEARELTEHPEAEAEALEAAYGNVVDGTALFHSIAVEDDNVIALDHVDLFVNEQRDVTEQLAQASSGEGSEVAADLWELLGDAGHRSLALRESLSCDAEFAVLTGENTDLLGPEPAECQGLGTADAPESDREPDGDAPSDPEPAEPGRSDETGRDTEDDDTDDDEPTDSDDTSDSGNSPQNDVDDIDESNEDESGEDDDPILGELSDVLSRLLG